MCPQDTVKKSRQGLTCKKRAHSPDPLSVWCFGLGRGRRRGGVPYSCKICPLGTKLII